MDSKLEPKCLRCNDSGTIGINNHSLNYIGPGPVPEDAKGICEVFCDCEIGQTISFKEQMFNWSN